MIKTFGDIKTAVIVRSGISTTSTYYTDTILDDWIQEAERWATSYKKWAFTEGRQSTTYTTTEEWNFEGLKTDSTRYLEIGSKRYQKLNFEDYKILQEKESSNEDRVYTDFNKTLLINVSAGGSGTLTVFGQYTPVPIDVTDEAAETVFSASEEEGNTAIVEEVLSYFNTREKRFTQAANNHQTAINLLDSISNTIGDEQYAYHTHRARGGMWERIDVVEGGVEDELFKRDQF